jgi:hypothetical protein
MNSVTVTGPPSVSGNVGTPQDPWYNWTFPVVVNGQAGVATIGFDTNDPSVEPLLESAIIQDLEQDDSDLGGISDNSDPGTDQDLGDFPDGDDDDTAVASNDGDDSTDSA